ncbi:MAG: hypothetical protein J5506_06365 [Prevotella sp.]|nr:hypothetical protein [Prevotella sp.]
MRQTQTFFRTLAAVILVFGLTTTANAQFGNILKTAKQTVKMKAQRAKATVRDKKNSIVFEHTTGAVLGASNSAGDKVYGAINSVMNKGNNAIRSAKQGAINSITGKKGGSGGAVNYSKGFKYKDLDETIFPYSPMESFPDFFSSAGNSDKLDQICAACVMAVLNGKPIDQFVNVTLKDGRQGVVPIDELFRHAYCTQFLNTPTDFEKFKKVVPALLFVNRGFAQKAIYPMDDPAKGIVNINKSQLLLWQSKDQMDQARLAREEAVIEVACNTVDYNQLSEYLRETYALASASTDPNDKAMVYMMAETVYNEIFTQHVDYDAAGMPARQIDLARAKFAQ